MVRRSILLTLAALFSAATALYSAAWMYYTDAAREVQLGVVYDFDVQTRAIALIHVERGTPADRAGLHPRDRITAVNGRRLTTPNPFSDAVIRGRVGDRVRFTVERSGLERPLEITTVLEARPAPSPVPLVQIVDRVLRLYPLAFLIVAVVVVFQKPEDRNAWLLALMFAAFIAAAPMDEKVVHPSLRGFGLGFKVIFAGLGPALFAYLFSVFPVRSPVDHRWPWLKQLLLGIAIAFAVPMGVAEAASSSVVPIALVEDKLDRWSGAIVGYVLICYGTGIVSLLWAYWRAPTAEARRRSRVIVWGTLVGFLPMFVLQTIGASLQRSIYEFFPLWVWAPAVLALFLLPVSVAYAVVKYRVLEIPVLLKRSARYVLVQRGFVVLLVAASLAATFALAAIFSQYFRDRSDEAAPAGLVVGVMFGVALTWFGTHAQRHITRRLDRAFFRSAYDARQLLEELAGRAHRAMDRNDLAMLLERSLSWASSRRGTASRGRLA